MIARRSPIAPDCTSSLARTHCGCVRTMNASPIFTPARSRAAIKRRASAAVILSGVSQSTCLPASAARIALPHLFPRGRRYHQRPRRTVTQVFVVGLVIEHHAHFAEIRGGALDHGAQIEIAVGYVDGENAAGLEMAEVSAEGLAREQM